MTVTVHLAGTRAGARQSFPYSWQLPIVLRYAPTSILPDAWIGAPLQGPTDERTV